MAAARPTTMNASRPFNPFQAHMRWLVLFEQAQRQSSAAIHGQSWALPVLMPIKQAAVYLQSCCAFDATNFVMKLHVMCVQGLHVPWHMFSSFCLKLYAVMGMGATLHLQQGKPKRPCARQYVHAAGGDTMPFLSTAADQCSKGYWLVKDFSNAQPAGRCHLF